jgi:flagellar P-ring protein FlgI
MSFTTNYLTTLMVSVLISAQAMAQAPPAQGPQNANNGPVAPAAAAPITPAAVATPIAPQGQNPMKPVRLNRLGQTILSPRISSITRVGNTMPHLLTGVGLITGLSQTGASDRGTRQAILNYIKQHGLNLSITDVVGGTTSLVALTCKLPPFAKPGMPIDVKAEVLSDALSLRGGHLMRAELRGVDGKVYVVAQGALTVAGYSASGQNASVDKNPSASAHIVNGGIVIREEQTSFFSASGALELQLLNPSPFNASSVAGGISTALAGMKVKVNATDPTMVRLELPDDKRTNEFAMRILGLVGDVRVAVENPTKVTIDQVSGTVLAGEGVLISPCVVGLSELTIAIVEEDFVSQPNAFAQGETARVGRTRVETQENSTELTPIGGGGATVADLLQNLKTLGLTPAQLVSVFVALDQGGFLHATLEMR